MTSQKMITLGLISLIASTLGSEDRAGRPLAGGTCVEVLVRLKTEEWNEVQVINAHEETTVHDLFKSIEEKFRGKLPSALNNQDQKQRIRVTFAEKELFMEERSSARLDEVGIELSDQSEITVDVVAKEIRKEVPGTFLIEIAIDEGTESGRCFAPGEYLIKWVQCDSMSEIPQEVKKSVSEMQSWIGTTDEVLEDDHDHLAQKLSEIFRGCPKHYFEWNHEVNRQYGCEWKIWVKVVQRNKK